MGVGLYGTEPEFTRAMDEFFTALGDGGGRLRALWLSPSPGSAIDDSANSQTLLFALGHALGRAVTARIEVDALLGHSVGELAAAATAGVFTTAEGAALMAARGRALRLSPEGAMLVVSAPVDRLREHVCPDIVIGAVNNARQTVLSGPRAPLRELRELLLSRGMACDFARSAHAFHSPMCTPAAREFERAFDGLPLAPPRVPIHSARTGQEVSGRQARSAEFWARQLDRPVFFSDAADSLLSRGRHLVLEAGPGGSCASLLKRNRLLRTTGSSVHPLLPSIDDSSALAVFESSLARVAEGGTITSGRSAHTDA